MKASRVKVQAIVDQSIIDALKEFHGVDALEEISNLVKREYGVAPEIQVSKSDKE